MSWRKSVITEPLITELHMSGSGKNFKYKATLDLREAFRDAKRDQEQEQRKIEEMNKYFLDMNDSDSTDVIDYFGTK